MKIGQTRDVPKKRNSGVSKNAHPANQMAKTIRQRKAPKTVRFRRYLAPLSGFEPLAFRLGVPSNELFHSILDQIKPKEMRIFQGFQRI